MERPGQDGAPRVYAGDYTRVWGAAERAIGAMDRARLLESAPDRGLLRALVRAPLGVRAELEVRLTELETGEVEVEAEAIPRAFLAVGLARRAAREVLQRMDDELRL